MTQPHPTWPPVLTTERLTLRGPQASDFDAFRAFYEGARSAALDGPLDPREAYRHLTAVAGHWHLAGFGWWVFEYEGQVAGYAGLHHPPYKPERELGWVAFDGFEGRGLAFEAAATALAWARANLAPGRIVSYITRGNARSERLAARLGARAEGPAPHSLGVDTWVHAEVAP